MSDTFTHDTRKRTRLLAAILTGVFLLAGSADHFGFHDCPHHGGHGSGHHDADAVASEVVEAGHLPSPTAPGEPEGPCTCVGSCHGSAGAATLRSPTSVVASGSVVHAATSTATVFRPSHEAYLLPYPNGPPPLG